MQTTSQTISPETTGRQRISARRRFSRGSERRTYRILPGVGPVDGILELPNGLRIDQLHAALDELKASGWTLDVESYSRLRGSYHHVGLVRTVGRDMTGFDLTA